MSTTLDQLEKRLVVVEQEISRLRQLVDKAAQAEPPSEAEPPLIREAKASQQAISIAAAKAFEAMGIPREPVGIEKLREMMAECGVTGDDNSFTRELLAMRDE